MWTLRVGGVLWVLQHNPGQPHVPFEMISVLPSFPLLPSWSQRLPLLQSSSLGMTDICLPVISPWSDLCPLDHRGHVQSLPPRQTSGLSRHLGLAAHVPQLSLWGQQECLVIPRAPHHSSQAGPPLSSWENDANCSFVTQPSGCTPFHVSSFWVCSPPGHRATCMAWPTPGDDPSDGLSLPTLSALSLCLLPRRPLSPISTLLPSAPWHSLLSFQHSPTIPLMENADSNFMRSAFPFSPECPPLPAYLHTLPHPA